MFLQLLLLFIGPPDRTRQLLTCIQKQVGIYRQHSCSQHPPNGREVCSTASESEPLKYKCWVNIVRIFIASGRYLYFTILISFYSCHHL